jgi:hypothetical protein
VSIDPSAPSVTDHSYVPGACAFPGCGRSTSAHAEVASALAGAALEQVPDAAQQHLIDHVMRVVEGMHSAADQLLRQLHEAARSGKLEIVAGLVQENVLPSLAPQLHVDLRGLARLARPAASPALPGPQGLVAPHLPPGGEPSAEEIEAAFLKLQEQS